MMKFAIGNIQVILGVRNKDWQSEGWFYIILTRGSKSGTTQESCLHLLTLAKSEPDPKSAFIQDLFITRCYTIPWIATFVTYEY